MLNDQSINSSLNEPHRSPGFVQKQPPELFCKKISSWKFRKFHRETHVLESLFNSVAGRNFVCERLLLFVSPQNTMTNSSVEFRLEKTSTECKVFFFLNATILFNQMQPYNLYVRWKKSSFNISVNILKIKFLTLHFF